MYYAGRSLKYDNITEVKESVVGGGENKKKCRQSLTTIPTTDLSFIDYSKARDGPRI